jgi:ankyrin repeat protein
MAVYHKQIQIVEFICQDETLQSLINHCDKNGETPFHLACFTKNEAIIKLITEVGAKINHENRQNEKPPQVVDEENSNKDIYQSVYTFTQQTTQVNTVTLTNTTTPTLTSKLSALQNESPSFRPQDKRTSIIPLGVPLITVNNSRVSVSVSATDNEGLDFDPHHSLNLMENSAISLVNSNKLVMPSNLENGTNPSKISINSRSSGRYDSRLEVRLPKELSYETNKLAPLPPPDSDRWLTEVDYDS